MSKTEYRDTKEVIQSQTTAITWHWIKVDWQ